MSRLALRHPPNPFSFNYTPSLPTLSVLVNSVTIPAKASKLISLRAGEGAGENQPRLLCPASLLLLPRWCSASWVGEVKLDTGIFKKQPCLRTFKQKPKKEHCLFTTGPLSLLPRDHMRFLLGESGGMWVCPKGGGGFQSRQISPIRRI